MKWFLVFVTVLAIATRLYRITNPLADWHSFRQADTASVTREYVKHGIDLLHPKYHDLSNIQSGKDNPQGYRMVEFPLVNGFTATVIKLGHLEQQEELVGRIVSVAFSLVTLWSLYLFGKELSNARIGAVAAFLFAVMPYAVYYSRVVLPEPALLATTMLALTLFLYWIKTKHAVYYVGSLLAFAFALLLKPFAVFLYPVFLALTYSREGYRGFKNLWVYIYLVLTAVPLLLWRRWILQFPEGIPASDWLYNKEHIRFSGAFFHWLFEVRISSLILGIGLVVPAVFGLIKKGKDLCIYWVWAAGLIAYMVVFAGGNVQHDYYQVILIPFLMLIAARGVDAILSLPNTIISPYIAKIAIVGLVIFSLFVSWYTVRGYFNVNHWEIVEAGKAADRVLPKDAKVIAQFMGDTAFLYQTHRTGWPIGFEIDEKIKKGAQYYVSVNGDDETQMLEKIYTVVEKTDKYTIINLQEKLKK